MRNGECGMRNKRLMQKDLPLRYRLSLHQGVLAVRESVAHSPEHHAVLIPHSAFRTPQSWGLTYPMSDSYALHIDGVKQIKQHPIMSRN